MPTDDRSIPVRRERILAAFSPELLRTSAARLSELLGDHFHQVTASQKQVLNWRDPESNVQDAAARLRDAPDDRAAPSQEELLERFEQIVKTMLDRGHNLHDPRYLGHQVPASVPLAGLFDAVGSVTNQVMAAYEMGPWATAVEHALIREIGGQIGWPEGTFSGLVTHGGSLANLTAILTARNVVMPTSWEKGLPRDGPAPMLVVQYDAHYSVSRSAGILGMGTHQVARAPLDARRRMDPKELDRLLSELRVKGHPILAVSACACATPIGAFDPLEAVADVCERHGVWLHVDAAHGGAACFSDRYKPLVQGLARADSVVLDAHKMLFVPSLCAFVFYKNREHRFTAFQQEAPYLFDPSAPGLAEYDSGLKTLECTKRAAVFGLYGVWRLFGRQLFADMIDETFDLGKWLYQKLVAAPDFHPLHEPECNIVAFRYLPKAMENADEASCSNFQLQLRRAVIESGDFYLVPWKLDGKGGLRVTIINPLTTDAQLDLLLDTLRRYGQKLLTDTA